MITVPYVDGPLVGAACDHDGEGPPPPAEIVHEPMDFGNVRTSSDGDTMSISITRRMWVYVLAARDEPPGWEYRLAAKDNEWRRLIVAEQQTLLDAAVAGARAELTENTARMAGFRGGRRPR